MSSLIGMCVHCTDENGRYEYFEQSIRSLLQTVDTDKHRIMLINNGSNAETTLLISKYVASGQVTVINPGENVGTARGINFAMALRKTHEKFIKTDDDIVWENSGWVEGLESVIDRDHTIGIAGLKRKDLEESPNNIHPFYKSELIMLPHEPGQSWISVEKVKHVMGSCQMLSPKLIESIGFYHQTEKYGLDDSEMSYRSELAGFKNVFWLGVNINHVDNGGGEYTQWKYAEAGKGMAKYHSLCESYRTGAKSLYYDGGIIK